MTGKKKKTIFFFKLLLPAPLQFVKNFVNLPLPWQQKYLKKNLKVGHLAFLDNLIKNQKEYN